MNLFMIIFEKLYHRKNVLLDWVTGETCLSYLDKQGEKPLDGECSIKDLRCRVCIIVSTCLKNTYSVRGRGIQST